MVLAVSQRDSIWWHRKNPRCEVDFYYFQVHLFPEFFSLGYLLLKRDCTLKLVKFYSVIIVVGETGAKWDLSKIMQKYKAN